MKFLQGCKLWLTALFALALSGCFQAQLNGPVSGAQITVNDLRDPAVVHLQAGTGTPESVIEEKGRSTWDGYGNLLRLLHLGVTDQKIENAPADRLYLATALGGQDADVNRDLAPERRFSEVSGQWHAIIPGRDLNKPEIKVSALTEALYVWLAAALPALDDSALVDTLDQVAPRLVGDIDKSGTVDYSDVLEWSRLLEADLGLFRGDIDLLNQIATNIRNNGSLERRLELAETLIGSPAPGSLDTESFFDEHIAADILSARCLACHVEDGVADNGGARLIFEPDGTAGQAATNIEAFRDFIDEVEDGDELILSKVQGVGHGGGAIFGSFTEEYQDLEAFLDLAAGGSGIAGGGATLSQFWNGVTLGGPTTTLRRAALILAGRLPTEQEYAQARRSENGLRRAIKGMMQGEGFHDFLIRGANDRLHTLAFLNGLNPLFVSEFVYPYEAEMRYQLGTTDAAAYFDRVFKFQYAGALEPLELIAHVVENNKPYTEILTADYTVANRVTATSYGAASQFGGEDEWTFKPVKNRGQIIPGNNYRSDISVLESGIALVELTHDNNFLDYPHAGVLNNPAFLDRYPTTETNRNRARSRWTYYHFLGVDIEKSASRTNDPEALADRDNPTLKNPNCTVCHTRMDPLAGTFQNYGNQGVYRDQGPDSLPGTYKYTEDSPYQNGDTWFRDMLPPGFEGYTTNNQESSLQWLARQIVQDPRFATATVGFWWPAMMGAEALEAPESPSDPGYDQLLAAFDAQQATFAQLGEKFAAEGFQLKDLLVDMVLSPWFRANRVDPAIADRRALELAGVGTRRLLTPEELENKTHAVLGLRWNEQVDTVRPSGRNTALNDLYRTYYGGIDSFGIQERARALTPLMANVALGQGIELACQAVALDFARPPAQRRLFRQVQSDTTPLYQGGRSFTSTSQDYGSPETFSFSLQLESGTGRVSIAHENPFWDAKREEGARVYIESLQVLRNGKQVALINGHEFPDQSGFEGLSAPDNQGNRYPVGDTHGEVINGQWQPVAWTFWGIDPVSFELVLPESGQYTFRVKTWGLKIGPESPRVTVSLAGVDAAAGNTNGASAIRQQISELYALMLGSELTVDHPEITRIYNLLVERWEARQDEPGNSWAWTSPESECAVWQNREPGMANVGADPHQMLNAWNAVMLYLMTHFDYLHE